MDEINGDDNPCGIAPVPIAESEEADPEPTEDCWISPETVPAIGPMPVPLTLLLPLLLLLLGGSEPKDAPEPDAGDKKTVMIFEGDVMIM